MAALLAFLGVTAYELAHFAGAVAQLPPVAWRKPWGGIERCEPAPDYRAARSVYPYSVVPGGVLSAAELEAAMARDPIVAGHYRDIVAARLLATRLNVALKVYASYRTAQSVRWTSHPIRVPIGELILSDGANLIRARCGNRLKFTRPEGPKHATPETPAIEPPELVFEHGMPPVLTRPGLPGPPGLAAAPLPDAAHFWPPTVGPPPWCCGAGGSPGYGYPGYPNPPERPAPRSPGIPEPLVVVLFGSGALITALRLAT